MESILTKERRSALNGLIAHWISEQDPEGSVLDTLDYFDVDKIDQLIDEAIAPAIADAIECDRAALAPSDAVGAPSVVNIHQVKLKSRKEMDRTIPRERMGWWRDVSPSERMVLRDATVADLARCHLRDGDTRSPEDFLCELPADGSLVSREALEFCRTTVIHAAPVAPAALDVLAEFVMRVANNPDEHSELRDEARATLRLAEIERKSPVAPAAVAPMNLTANDADMVWPVRDDESFYHTLDDAVEQEISNAWPIEAPVEFKFRIAKRIPTVTIRVTEVTENGHEWEIVDAALQSHSEGEKS
jgi:hypothetical protein